MRLLHTKTFRSQEFLLNRATKYAILSPTWEEGEEEEEEEEVTFQDMENGAARKMKGYTKLKKSCRRARDDGYTWIWIDTCCIDRKSSAELTESISAIFEYYSMSAVCYAYLADIKNPDESLQKSRWFTRGWTLQELLPPRVVIFFDRSWKEVGEKQANYGRICSSTGIPEEVVKGFSVEICNIAQRRAWASQRQTTREEDIAYCLLGIFDVQMSLIYGEGVEKAFLRLQEEILRRNSDHTLFVWTPEHDPYNQGLLASSSRAFCTHLECFEWMHVEIYSKAYPFDPYAPLLRNSQAFSKKVRIDGTDARIPVSSRDDRDLNLPPPSLGQSGLQISLLSRISDKGKMAQSLGENAKMLLLDLEVLGGPEV